MPNGKLRRLQYSPRVSEKLGTAEHAPAAVLARVLLLIAGSLPFLVRPLRAVPGGARVADLLAVWFAFQCHGRLDRTLVLFGRFLPVCSRCTGLYAGLALGALLPWRSLAARTRRAWVLAAFALMAGEVVVQNATNHAPWHAARLLTGVLVGWPIAMTVVAAVEHRRREPHPPARGERRGARPS